MCRIGADNAMPWSGAADVLTVRVAQAVIPLYAGDPRAWGAVERLPREATSVAHRSTLFWGTANVVGACFYLGHYRRAQEAHLAAGDAAAAVDAAERGLEVVRRKGIWAWGAELVPPAVDALVATARPAAASALVAEFARGMRGRDAPLAAAALTLCRGALAEAAGETQTAARAYRRAQAAYAGLPRPHDAALAALRAGSTLLDGGDRRGGAVLVEALAALETLGASADARRVRRALRQRSISIPRPVTAGRRAYGDRLTPRQQEVVARAARGMTNAEIGNDLFLSQKTVEHHLALAMQKLGVSSRRELRQAP